MDHDAVVLADSGAGARNFAFILVVGAIPCTILGTRHGLMPVIWLGAALFAGAAILMVRRLWSHTSVVFDRRGLCVMRNGRVEGMLPAHAIREVVLAEKAHILELRLTFDQSAVPVLPPAIEEFKSRWKEGDGRVPGPGTIILGRVSSDSAALTIRKAFRVHRLVEDNGIAEWRRISDP